MSTFVYRNDTVYYRTPRAIGDAIRTRRKELSLTQSDVARKMGVSRQWLVAVEQGKPGAELGLILRGFNVLRMSVRLVPYDIADGEEIANHKD